MFRLDYRTKCSVRQEGIPNRFNALHSDSERSECPLENPLNFSRSRQLLAQDDVSEVTSSTKTDISQTTSSLTVQDDISTRDDSTHCGSSLNGLERERKSYAQRDETAGDTSYGKERDKFVSRRNRKYIVSPFRVQRGSFDLAKPKSVVGNLGVDGKSLSYIEESLEESSKLTENAKDRNLGSNTAVRWRITVKHQHTTSTPEHAVSEV